MDVIPPIRWMAIDPSYVGAEKCRKFAGAGIVLHSGAIFIRIEQVSETK
jgi:hypothetical protein